MFSEFYISFFLSIILGSIIGAQREIRQQKYKIPDFAGFRTYSLVCLMGFITTYISLFIDFYFLIAIAFLGIFGISYFSYYEITKNYPNNISISSQIVFILTFLMGVLIGFNLYQISITLTIIIVAILFLGNHLHKFAKNLKENEIFATLKFALLSLVILPILPNENYSLMDIPFINSFFISQTLFNPQILFEINIFNPFKIWLIVVFISGISYLGYILMKTVGAEKGIEITGFLGGLVSSTATTSSFSIESKKTKYFMMPILIGAIIASSTMFLRIILEIMVINPNILGPILLSLIGMSIFGFLLAFYLLKTHKLNKINKLNLESPFSLGPAFKFALFFVFILFFSKLFSIIFGEKGIFILAFVSGFADVDAITISLANLAKTEIISSNIAQIGILIAVFSNSIFKSLIAFYLGSQKFAKGLTIYFISIIILGTILYLI
ncbi:MgtC/SapB family protein [bacterium]|nr:MgtC/SapB family protein [bacterium]